MGWVRRCPWWASQAPVARSSESRRRPAPTTSSGSSCHPDWAARTPSSSRASGSPVEGLDEPVGAVQRDRYRGDRAGSAEGVPDGSHGGEPGLLDCPPLRHVLGEPEVAGTLDVQGQDDHWTTGHATQLGQAPCLIRPLVDGEDGHRRVDAGVVERQRLGDGVDRRVRAASLLVSSPRGLVVGITGHCTQEKHHPPRPQSCRSDVRTNPTPWTPTSLAGATPYRDRLTARRLVHPNGRVRRWLFHSCGETRAHT